jgi:hypothetical protein
MTSAKRAAILILFGVGVLVLAIFVLVRHKDLNSELLATIGILGGLAIVVVSLPTSNGK